MYDLLTVDDERVVCVFPCIGSGNTHVFDLAVVTTNDEREPYQRFTLRRCFPNGEPYGSTADSNAVFTSFPAAIRAARQSQGWG